MKDLKEMLQNCIECWQEVAGHEHTGLEEIIVYRTGISKIDYTKKKDLTKQGFWEEEMSKIEAAANACDITEPSIAIISVEKNHKTKFYPRKDANLSPLASTWKVATKPGTTSNSNPTE